jgi:imidazole glycerol-phosphate synthase subunit HisF
LIPRLRIASAIFVLISVPFSGAGCSQDFYDAFVVGKADAALAASTFHYDKINIDKLKHYLLSKNINVRL